MSVFHRRLTEVILITIVVQSAVLARAPSSDKILSVRLFKNGLAIIEREVIIPPEGECSLTDIPEPVHGTFWIDSGVPVHARICSWDALTEENHEGNMPTAKAIVHFRDADIPALTGTFERPEAPGPNWNREYATLHPRQRYFWGYAYPYHAPGTNAQTAPITIIADDGTRTIVDRALVSRIEVMADGQRWILSAGGQMGASAHEPSSLSTSNVMFLRALRKTGRPVRVILRYLSRGATWAPSYLVEMPDDEHMLLTQKAVLRNELMPLDDVPVYVISGFPHVHSAHVPSLFGPGETLQSFFQALARPGGPADSGMHSQMLFTSNAVSSQYGRSDVPILAPGPEGSETLDLHYQPLGKIDLLPGESMTMNVASAQAQFQRVVRWDGPSRRNYHGGGRETEKVDAWDTVRFTNPLAFPMTSAPVMISRKGQFLAQSATGWVSRGEIADIRLTKALDVRITDVEVEETLPREEVVVAGHTYVRRHITGTITLTSYRPKPVTIEVTRRFYGELESAMRSPATSHPVSESFTVNRFNQLAWNEVLAPGQTRQLTYRYAILVQ